MEIRNVAIIAHVDHGKTTLVDALLRQSKTKLDKELAQATLIMDTNELERERGITIFSKNASVVWNNIKINIIDTPGHADFGGEVERVLKMADGCLLLIDAKEGPMPQTRFVLRRALELHLKIIVVVNKIDRVDSQINEILERTLELFLELGADDKAADFPIVYASGKEGKAGLVPDLSAMTDITPLFDAITSLIPPPDGDPAAPLQMLVTTIGYDNFKGRIATGRVYNGTLSKNQEVAHIKRNGEIKKARLTSLLTFEGLNKVETERVETGDIAAIAGLADITIGETIADPQIPVPLPLLQIEEPTIKMIFMVNNSPFAGKEGEFKTSRQIEARLYKELETDMALRVENDVNGGWIVSGRGELHLAILIERMRREGYEFQVSRPQVIFIEENGEKQEPYERVFIEIPQDSSGIVMQKMGERHAQLEKMETVNGIVYFEYVISTRELFGYRTEFVTDCRGLGIINTVFYKYMPAAETTRSRERGSLVAFESGVTNMYGLLNTQSRGTLFVGPAVPVYKGQVVGQNARSDDLRINVCKTKQLSNMRSKGEGVTEHFNAPRLMNLEDALEYISDSEYVEVTPKSIRIRKIILDETEERRKASQGIK